MPIDKQAVRAQYEAMPWYQKAGTAADDVIRLGLNGFTWGGADKLASALGEQDTARRTAEARARAGSAGSLAGLFGAMESPGALIKGAGLAFKGAKVLPAIVSKAIGLLPKLNTGKNVGRLAGLVGGLSQMNNEDEAMAATPQPVATAPAAQAQAQLPSMAAAPPKAPVSAAKAALAAVDSSPTTFDSILNKLADSQHGKVSMRQIEMAAGVAQHLATRSGRTMSPADAIIQRQTAYADGIHAQEIANGVPQGQADANLMARYQDIRKHDSLADLLHPQDQNPDNN